MLPIENFSGKLFPLTVGPMAGGSVEVCLSREERAATLSKARLNVKGRAPSRRRWENQDVTPSVV